MNSSTAAIERSIAFEGAHPDALVEIQGLVKEYGAAHARLSVLHELNLSIAYGDRLALLGKSGSGKSTLLNLIGGLDVPTAGRIVVDGRQLADLSSNERANYRLETVGMIFQSFHLVAARSALENVELPMILAAKPRLERRRRAAEALKEVGMGHRLHQSVNDLSGGERQRVAIARALVNHPKLLLADEPTGNLDSATGDQIVGLLLEYLNRSGAALVLVTHDEDLARRCATRVLRMHDGVLLEN